MKKITLLILLISNLSFSQFDKQIDVLHKACNTSELEIESLFSSDDYNDQSDDKVYVFEYVPNGTYYVIDYSNERVISNYIEGYSKARIDNMCESISNIASLSKNTKKYKYYVSSEYIYLVLNLRKQNNTMVLTITKIK